VPSDSAEGCVLFWFVICVFVMLDLDQKMLISVMSG